MRQKIKSFLSSSAMTGRLMALYALIAGSILVGYGIYKEVDVNSLVALAGVFIGAAFAVRGIKKDS